VLPSPTNRSRLFIGPHGNRTGASGAFIDETTMPATVAMPPRKSTIRIRPESTKWLDDKADAAVALRQTFASPTRWELASHRACRMWMVANGVQYNALALYRLCAYGFEFDSATVQPATADLAAVLFYAKDNPHARHLPRVARCATEEDDTVRAERRHHRFQP
jgi:hypothetical protein